MNVEFHRNAHMHMFNWPLLYLFYILLEENNEESDEEKTENHQDADSRDYVSLLLFFFVSTYRFFVCVCVSGGLLLRHNSVGKRRLKHLFSLNITYISADEAFCCILRVLTLSKYDYIPQYFYKSRSLIRLNLPQD